MKDRDTVGRTGADSAIIAAISVVTFLIGAALAINTGIALAAAMFGHGWTLLPINQLPHLLAAALRHPTHLASTYPTADRTRLAGNAPSWVLVAVCLAGYMAIVAALLVLLIPLFLSKPGFERPVTASKLLGAAAVRRATTRLHPVLAENQRRPPIGGPRLGHAKRAGTPLYASLEDSILIVGPQGSQKSTGIIYRAVADAPGSVISTSTKPDVLLNTIAIRRDIGRVHVFDPQDTSGWPEVLRWPPSRGCEEPTTAIVRAEGMAEASKIGKGVTNSDYWTGQTSAVIRCYLHAAALAGIPATGIQRWTRNPKAEEPISILNEHPGAADGWGDELAEQKAAGANQVGNVWAGVRRAFDCLADPRVARACSPGRGDQFDPEEFIRNGETLYLLGSNKATLSVAPLIVAFIEDIIETGRHIAATSSGERMPLPMQLALDEVANIAPLPSLPYILGDGRGQGFQTITVFQSLAQARSRWGVEEADVIWDTSTARMILPGLGNQRDGKMISDLLGEYDEISHRKSRGRGATTYNEDIRGRLTVPVHAVRQIEPGNFLLIYRHLKPILGQLEVSYQGRDATRFNTALAEGRRLTGRTTRAAEPTALAQIR
jgi:hypothetical protein